MKDNQPSNAGFVTSATLLEQLFPDAASRPTIRWLELQRKARRIPFVKLGRLVRFDVARVREAINGQKTASFGTN